MAQHLLNSCPTPGIVLSSRMNRYCFVSQGPYCPMQKNDKLIKTALKQCHNQSTNSALQKPEKKPFIHHGIPVQGNHDRNTHKEWPIQLRFQKTCLKNWRLCVVRLLTCKRQKNTNNYIKEGRRPWSNR